MNPDFSTAWHPSDGMIRDADYEVPDEQFEHTRALTPLQRLHWLDEVRQFTLLARMAMHQENASEASAASTQSENGAAADSRKN